MPPLAILVATVVLGGLSPSGARAQTPLLSDRSFLAGDAAIGLSVERQQAPRIAFGGGNYLAVWEDLRADLAGWTNTSIPLIGNETDIYAARIDGSGNVLDALVVTNEGRNQYDPDVASNGQDWLIVYQSQRPDWYFFDDILAVRISGDGVLLDPEPIEVRPENNDPANDAGAYPSVTTDGTNWVLCWSDINWDVGPNVVARRMAPDGSWVDPEPVVLYQHPEVPFGPNYPRMAFNGSTYLLTYERLSGAYVLRLDQNLQPLDPGPTLLGTGSQPNVASNGDGFLVAGRERKVYRVAADGTVLDPGGVSLPIPGGYVLRSPDVAWDGDEWVLVAAGNVTSTDPDIYEIRMQPDGTITSAVPIAADPSDDQYEPAIDSDGNGASQAVWSVRAGTNARESVVGARLDGASAPDLANVSTGLPRQSFVRFATQGSLHAAVFVSQIHGESRILIQRIDSEGQPVDADPALVWSTTEQNGIIPEVAVDGTRWVVAWSYNGSVLARRFELDLTPVDPFARTVLTDAAGGVGISALGDEYYVAYTHTFSGDQRSLKGVRVSSSDLTPIGSALTIGGGYALSPKVETLGGRWFVVYERQVNHDIDTSSIQGMFIEPGGALGPWVSLSAAGDDDRPDVAVAGDRALVVFSDEISTTNAAIQARVIGADGTLLSGEVTIADAPREQFFPAACWTGEFFAVAWSDMRTIQGVEALRGDIYLARVDPDGNVLDPGGIQVSEGQLPEDLPALAGAGGIAVLGYSQLHGVSAPEVQRIAIHTLRELEVSHAPVEGQEPGLADGLEVGPNPFADQVQIRFRGVFAGPDSWRLDVFAPDGRRVWTEAVDPAAGAVWDGRDRQGAGVPNGVYHLRLTRNGEPVSSRRLVRAR